MNQKKLHPSVVKFKEFVKNHPKLIQEVRKGNATWQEFYEEWYLLGEGDPRWDSIGTEKKSNDTANAETKPDWISSFKGAMKKMDGNQMQYHLNNLSQAIGAIQGLITQFQGNNQPQQPSQTRKPQGSNHPFSFRKD